MEEWESMEEWEWLSRTTPEKMLDHVKRKLNVSHRKLRLFAAACLRHVWDDLPHDVFRELIEHMEDQIESERNWAFIAAAKAEASELVRNAFGSGARTGMPPNREWYQATAVLKATEGRFDIASVASMSLPQGEAKCKELCRNQSRWLRCIIGNPFRTITRGQLPRTSAVVDLARIIYEARDFARMPILADALEEAGCDNPDILSHCHGPGPHVRGCWVVDLVLGKS